MDTVCVEHLSGEEIVLLVLSMNVDLEMKKIMRVGGVCGKGACWSW